MREYERRVSPTKRVARWAAIRFAVFIRALRACRDAVRQRDRSEPYLAGYRYCRVIDTESSFAIGTGTSQDRKSQSPLVAGFGGVLQICYSTE
ncbi:hypothetical protein [Burkholderia oklahomensis]|uniref:hypothetical protein n=1 Tax=Burkholderia oklahomensis TaxID=342113 RepID=UPI00016A7F5E|nr:hypothetical protein [Burkholderia oklahomensis]